MQNYKEINGNDYVKDSRTTINETMRSIQSMNSGTSFPTNNLFEGMKCYRTDLKKTYTLTDVENNTWAEDAHAALADTASKLSTTRKINITGDATGDAFFDGTGDANISVTVSEAAHAKKASTADNVSGKIYYSADSPSVATDKLFAIKRATNGDDNVPNNGLVIQTGPTGAAYNGKLYITDNGSDGVWIGGVASGKEVGWTRLVENKGNWNINSATATKLQTPRTISLTGNASGAASFDGSGNVSINTTVSNSDMVDGVHAGSMFYNKGNWDADNWATMGAYQTNGTPPSGDWYGWGQVISSSAGYTRFQLYASDNYASDGRLHYRTGWGDRKNQWNTILDSENYNKFAPTKTGSGASGTWDITATNADKLDGYHASDIIGKITAANTGGITAASLTENGYVKFANGLILQWGVVSNTKAAKNYDITFPVSFASACFGVHNTYFKSSGEAGKSGDNWDTVAKITKYGCQLSADNQNVFWTAIGV